MLKANLTERAAVGCLGCYNEGRLNFRHMDADELEEWVEGTITLCDRPTHEEYHVQDYDGLIPSHVVGEYPNYEHLIEAMRMVEDNPDTAPVAILIADDYYEEPLDPDNIQNVLCHMLAAVDSHSLDEWAMEYAIDGGIISEDHPMFSYIDWNWYAQNLLYDYSTYEYGGVTYLMPKCW